MICTPEIFSRADHCLYEAKNLGRNCVVFEKTDGTEPQAQNQLPRTATIEDLAGGRGL
jgi:predicted signal transduction protein with EAL and GGDEF domain